jgi:hypothetical protein
VAGKKSGATRTTYMDGFGGSPHFVALFGGRGTLLDYEVFVLATSLLAMGKGIIKRV